MNPQNSDMIPVYNLTSAFHLKFLCQLVSAINSCGKQMQRAPNRGEHRHCHSPWFVSSWSYKVGVEESQD